MSEFDPATLAADLMAQTAPELENLAGELADGFLGGMEAILKDAPSAAKAKVEALIREGFQFKQKAMTAATVENARAYAEAVEKTQRRVKTVLLAESIVAQETTAALVADMFGKALDGLAVVTKGLITTVAMGLVKGAIAGLTGGGGGDLDPSSIFPFA